MTWAPRKIAPKIQSFNSHVPPDHILSHHPATPTHGHRAWPCKIFYCRSVNGILFERCVSQWSQLAMFYTECVDLTLLCLTSLSCLRSFWKHTKRTFLLIRNSLLASTSSVHECIIIRDTDICSVLTLPDVFTARCTSAKRGIAIACRPSVCNFGGSGSHRLEILNN